MSTCIDCIWDEFSQPLRRFIKQRITNEEDAEDVFQEVFLKILNNIKNLKDDNKINAWIYQITRNTITDYYRKKGKKPEYTELNEDMESSTDEESSANTEIAACLKVMIDNLPEIYKQAILLSEFENMTQREIGEKLGISLSGAKSRIQRGRKMLKEMLYGCCELELDSMGNIIDYEHKTSECKYC